MKNLTQFRNTLVLFSVGVVGVTLAIADKGDSPSAVDSATDSIVHRINPQAGGSASEQNQVFMVSSDSASDARPAGGSQASAGSSDGADNPWAFDDDDTPGPPPAVFGQSQPDPTTLIIHK